MTLGPGERLAYQLEVHRRFTTVGEAETRLLGVANLRLACSSCALAEAELYPRSRTWTTLQGPAWTTVTSTATPSLREDLGHAQLSAR